MRSAILDFPIKHIDKNLVFGYDGTVTAYFRISGFNYDFLEHDDKFKPFQSQIAFLYNNRYDLHYISEPFPTNVIEIIENTIADMETKEYDLKESGLMFMNELKRVLTENQNSNETTEYHQYFGIQLNAEKNKYPDGNAGLMIIEGFKNLFKGLNSTVNKMAGFKGSDLLESEIKAWHDQADIVHSSLYAAFNSKISKATTAECVYLIEKEFSVTQSNSDIEVKKNIIQPQVITANLALDDDGEKTKYVAIRPNAKNFIELFDTNIEEINPTTLKLSKILNDDDTPTEYYTKYLVAHTMHSENQFPSFEWLYNIQATVAFPVSISIRAYHQSNERIVKRLSNKRLEFKDQRAEANKAGEHADLALDESETGAIRAEAYFKKSGQPAYSCSFVFRISSDNQKELDTRAKRLKEELSRYGIKIVSPYGEQMNLLMEKMVGSRQINQDYKIEADSGILAGMMFGATTSVGDNRGFLIGYTERLNRPVFVQPDLAAKAFSGLGNLEDSISAVVAGATGKGKSFFMNFYTYMSCLTGSQALIIDPKGDRKGWDSLPLIDSEHISKWTLGSNNEDAGCLDPFRTSVDLEEGKTIALDILSYLINCDIKNTEYTILSEAVEYVGTLDDPCIGAVIDYLDGTHSDIINKDITMSEKRFNALESVRDTMQALKRQKISTLLFGEVGQKYKVLKVDKPMQILMVENLNLPDKSTASIRPSQKISEGILISITAFTKQYMFQQDRSRHKIILQDEASSIDSSAVGREMMDFIVRKGRYYNTTLLKGSQNATDHGEDIANMGMKFSFGLRTTKEASQMLEFLNLPQTEGNISRIRSLEKGNCLFQDIYGRTAIIRVDPIFGDLMTAFDSSTSTEEERERERKRSNNYDDIEREEKPESNTIPAT